MQDVYGCIKSLIPEHQVTVKDTGKLESKCEIFVENLRYVISRLLDPLHIFNALTRN